MAWDWGNCQHNTLVQCKGNDQDGAKRIDCLNEQEMHIDWQRIILFEGFSTYRGTRKQRYEHRHASYTICLLIRTIVGTLDGWGNDDDDNVHLYRTVLYVRTREYVCLIRISMQALYLLIYVYTALMRARYCAYGRHFGAMPSLSTIS